MGGKFFSFVRPSIIRLVYPRSIQGVSRPAGGVSGPSKGSKGLPDMSGDFQRGLRACQGALSAFWSGLMACQGSEGLPKGLEGLLEGSEGSPEGPKGLSELSVPYFGKVGVEPKSLAQLILGQYDRGNYTNGAYRCSQNIPHLAQS